MWHPVRRIGKKVKEALSSLREKKGRKVRGKEHHPGHTTPKGQSPK